MSDFSTPIGAANGTSTGSTTGSSTGPADKAAKAGKDIKSAAEEIKTAAGEIFETTKEEVKARAEKATVEGKRIFEDTKAKAQDQLTEFEGVVRERPLFAVAAAVAVGLLIGNYITAKQPKVIYLKDRRWSA